MPWRETCPMNERVRFVTLAREKMLPFSSLCGIFNISRETGYKWLNRFNDEGLEGLNERSCKPHNNPRMIDKSFIDPIVKIKHKHPTWGPKKIAVILQEQHHLEKIPATSTIGEILKREGLVKERRRRARLPQHLKPNLDIRGPNDLWCTDFKGHFLLRDGIRCHPLTLTDAFSRFLLCCHGEVTEAIEPAKKAFERVFSEFGIPNAILSDNGIPFASSGTIGLTRLSAWWIKLGITPVRIQPGRPDQNGKHERFHRTLKDQTARPPRETMIDQQEAFDRFQNEYNFERPHEALQQKRPHELYKPSAKEFSSRLSGPEYPLHFEKRRVDCTGKISWFSKDVFISEVLEKETIALEEIGDDLWLAYFYHFPIGLFNARDRKMVALPRMNYQPGLSGLSPV